MNCLLWFTRNCSLGYLNNICKNFSVSVFMPQSETSRKWEISLTGCYQINSRKYLSCNPQPCKNVSAITDYTVFPYCCGGVLLVDGSGRLLSFAGMDLTLAEALPLRLILWPPGGMSQFIGKDPDAGKDWKQEEKGTEEDEMVGWHHWFNGHECEQASGHGEGQGSLTGYSPWGHNELDMTKQLNNCL